MTCKRLATVPLGGSETKKSIGGGGREGGRKLSSGIVFVGDR